IADAGPERLQQVEDIGPKVAESISEHLGRMRDEIARLRERGVNLDVLDEDKPVEVAADAPLAGETIVITGKLADPRTGERIPRPAFARLCERAGATVASSVTGATTKLVTGADVGATKTAKAEKLGVEVVDQEWVWKRLIDA